MVYSLEMVLNNVWFLYFIRKKSIPNKNFVRLGKEWQDLRKPLDKLLTKKMVESNLDMFHEKSIKLCNVLNKYAKTGENFNVRHYITNFTTDALSGKCITHTVVLFKLF